MLIVTRYPKKPGKKFHPRLVLEKTGYSPRGQWCGLMFGPGIYPGLAGIGEMNFTEAVQHYLSELKRCGHVPVEDHEQPAR